MLNIRCGIILLFFGQTLSFGQSNQFAQLIRDGKFEEALSATSELSRGSKQQLLWQTKFAQNFDLEGVQFNSLDGLPNNPSEPIGKFYIYLNQGDYLFFGFPDKAIEAFEEYKRALNYSLEIKKPDLICASLRRILFLHRQIYFFNNTTYLDYLKLYDKHAFDEVERMYFNYYSLTLNFKKYDLANWNSDLSKKLRTQLKKEKNQDLLKAQTFFIHAIYHEETNQRDSLWYYIDLSERYLFSSRKGLKKVIEQQLASYKARIALQEGDSVTAKSALSTIENNARNLMDYKVNGQKSYYSAIIDTLNGDFRSAFSKYFIYEETMNRLRDNRYNNLMNELDKRYQTAEKDKQVLLEQKQKTQNRNIAIGLGGTLALGSVIGLLAYRNTKRKQRIAEQQREIEIQKTEKILKEQELTTIDAMIAGQEKERQRLASDLHDSVGATLSAARLQFEHIAANKDQLDSLDELLQKTGVLLDEAYNEVRSMAHAKNSGVIAKNGLLPAVERLAKNVSGTNTLKVEVQDFGLENRLDNSLEIAIFRIIQELITNVIKHARATEAHISITQHEDALSIIVEDNGRGFNARKLPKKEGMGLSSIETRVEHMEGTMEVDSTPGQGTSVLIDIPL